MAAISLMHQPSGAVPCAQVAHERQRRQPGLVLADEVDGQEPDAQRQLGAVEHRASGQRRLMATFLALEQPARAVAHNVVFCAIATRAAKPIRPAHRSERRGALVFAAVAGEELQHRHTKLKLDSVHRHGWPLGSNMSQRRGRQAHGLSLAEVCDESGGTTRRCRSPLRHTAAFTRYVALRARSGCHRQGDPRLCLKYAAGARSRAGSWLYMQSLCSKMQHMNASTTLTPRQARFVDEYLVDGNGARAAVAAGYGVSGARVRAHRLTRDNEAVRAEIARRQAADSQRLEIDRDAVIRGILAGIDIAKQRLDAASVIRGWAELGKMLGYYAPVQHAVGVSGAVDLELGRLNRLSDAELVKLIEAGAAG